MMNNMVKKDLTQDIGSRMSGNFVCIRDTLTIREAMSELVRQESTTTSPRCMWWMRAVCTPAPLT